MVCFLGSASASAPAPAGEWGSKTVGGSSPDCDTSARSGGRLHRDSDITCTTLTPGSGACIPVPEMLGCGACTVEWALSLALADPIPQSRVSGRRLALVSSALVPAACISVPSDKTGTEPRTTASSLNSVIYFLRARLYHLQRLDARRSTRTGRISCYQCLLGCTICSAHPIVIGC